MKPSSNTLITLHSDYDPGGAMGRVIDAAGLREALESRWRKVLDNVQRGVYEAHK